MIRGIGIDSVEIKRFAHWHTKSHEQLSKLFSDDEIAYCLQEPIKSAERFAVRFAAKEAAYKAFCSAFPDFNMPLAAFCSLVSIEKEEGAPRIIIAWNALNLNQNNLKMHCSLTHTASTATAILVLEQPYYAIP